MTTNRLLLAVFSIGEEKAVAFVTVVANIVVIWHGTPHYCMIFIEIHYTFGEGRCKLEQDR
jgi:hypothetical protein